MVAKEDLKVGSTYRAKRYREVLGFNNDRTIVWMGATELQYNSATVKIGRRYPIIDIEKFLRWAKEGENSAISPRTSKKKSC